ncbi:hypothetical protein [Planktothrix agardhii]|uniref:hypothetical protein n=1 Tax=Planktothrix agardhii TaxID=1160 RepID=UPI0020A73F2C|nr:hypothetical protein [Planktothrix agardhii]
MVIALHFIRWRSLFLYSFSPDFETALRARGARGGGIWGENTSPSGFQYPSGVLTALAIAYNN